jgi:hypothetical protein
VSACGGGELRVLAQRTKAGSRPNGVDLGDDGIVERTSPGGSVPARDTERRAGERETGERDTEQ